MRRTAHSYCIGNYARRRQCRRSTGKAAAVSSDKDKLIRQLSLVAYLMSVAGRKVSSWDIRRAVEEYEGMKDEAFDRRFYADRAELTRLGINVMNDGEGRGGSSETTLYWLPPENFFLPEINFSREELAALGACLGLLQDQFAYGDILRLALMNLALGAGNPLSDPAPGYINVNLLTSGFDSAAAGQLSRIESAIGRKKTLLFNYEAMGRGVEERRVDPYLLMFIRGDWYLVGRSHEREAIRIFKLRRIRGRIRNATRAERDFTLPGDFDRRRYESLEPWQLGPETGTAVIRVSPRSGWWVEQNLSHSGSIEMDDAGAAEFTTAYSGEAQLLSLVLGLGDDAELLRPRELREQMPALLGKIAALHDGPAPAVAEPAGEQPAAAGPVASPRQVKPERFTRLATLAALLIDRLGGEETVILDAAAVAAELGYPDSASLAADLELLLMVSIDAGGYVVEGYIEGDRLRVERCVYGDVMSRPARLSPLEARALLLAIDLVGSHIPAGGGNSLRSARAKIVQAAGGPGEEQLILVSETGAADAAKSSVISRGIEERRLVEIEHLSPHGDRPVTRLVEPYLITNTKREWYAVTWCRLAGDIRVFRFAMIRSARLLDEHFEPRDIDLEAYRADPLLPSGREAAYRARVWFSAEIARYVGEERPLAQPLADGGLIDEVPYFDENWLVREILKHRGEAVVLAPAPARRLVARAAARIAERYG